MVKLTIDSASLVFILVQPLKETTQKETASLRTDVELQTVKCATVL